MSTGSKSAKFDRRSWGAAGGIAAAVVIGVFVNVLASRHYQRFDWTEAGLYTLHPTTIETIKDLSEPIEITVLLATGDPLELTVRHLLVAYGAKSTRLVVRFVDPERETAAFLALQQKHSITLGRTDSGQLVSDAAIVVSRGSHHHFIASDGLVAITERGARPRVELVLTAAIRRVLAGEAPQVCFTSGHGEPSLEQGGATGLLALGGRLEKNNYAVRTLPPAHTIRGDDPIRSCRVVVIAAPTRALPVTEVERLSGFARSGGNMLVALGPVPNPSEAGYVKMGVGPLLAVLGVRMNRDFVFERDESRRVAGGFGETFIAQLGRHRLSESLLAGGGVDVRISVASSIEKLPTFEGKVDPLLTTSESSFAMADFFAWAKDPSQSPEPEASDRRGPLTIAIASERVVAQEGKATKGPSARAVVIGSPSVAYGGTWQDPQWRGTTLFTESALSWLTAAPMVLDIPAKRTHAPLTVTHDLLRQVLLLLVCVVPLSMLLIGVAVRSRRTKTKGARRPTTATKGDSK